MGGTRAARSPGAAVTNPAGATSWAGTQLDAPLDAARRRGQQRRLRRVQEDPGSPAWAPRSWPSPGPRTATAFINVGDSRIYLLRDAELEQLTIDHSLVEEMVREGRITPEEALTHPKRNIVTRALGISPWVQVDSDTITPVTGDRFLLCSDGLFNEVEEDLIASVLRHHADPADAASELVRLANDSGGRDNITVVLDVSTTTTGRARRGHHRPGPDDMAGFGRLRRRRPPAQACPSAGGTGVNPGRGADGPRRFTWRWCLPARPRRPVGRRRHRHYARGTYFGFDDTARHRLPGSPAGCSGRAEVVTTEFTRRRPPCATSRGRLGSPAALGDRSSSRGRPHLDHDDHHHDPATTTTLRDRADAAARSWGSRPRPLPIASTSAGCPGPTATLLATSRCSSAVLGLLCSLTSPPAARPRRRRLLLPAAQRHRLRVHRPSRRGPPRSRRPRRFQASGSATARRVRGHPGVVRRARDLRSYKYLAMVAGVGLLMLPLAPIIGRSINGARIWVEIGPVGFQPGEFAKIALAVFFAGYLADNRELLGLSALHPKYRPRLVAWGASLMVIFFQKDLGSSLLFFASCRPLWVATGRGVYLRSAWDVAAGPFVPAFAHVQDRMATNEPLAEPGRRQPGARAGSLAWATGSGPAWAPERIPVVETDHLRRHLRELGLPAPLC
jgi:hypothetical protein